MNKPRGERARWTEIFLLPEPSRNDAGSDYAHRKHGEARAVLEAFQKVGRVVRIEPSKFGNGIVFKARKS